MFTVDPLYLPQLQASSYYDQTSEYADTCVAEVHLRKEETSENLSRYHSASWIHRTYTTATVDMFKLISNDPSGCIDEEDRTCVLIQEYSWFAGRKNLKREYVLGCDQANLLYKNLLKRDFYRR